MSRAIFSANNKVGQVFSFQTNVTSGSTFDPTITFVSGSDRVSWDLGNGKLVAGNGLSYTFTGDTGTTKTIKLRTNRLSKLKEFQADIDSIVGRLDMSKWSNLGNIVSLYSNPNLTAITHTYSQQTFSFPMGYSLSNCNLTGNHDMSMFPNLGNALYINNNINLTGITHTASTQIFRRYYAYSCNLTGNHDISMFTNLGGIFQIYSNSGLTGIIHTASTQTFTQYYASNCNLDYVNFKPLSGATFKNCIINLNGNNMISSDVNHILDDFKIITVANSTRWSGITLNIGGTNQTPDSSSGGYNGLAAITTLTGSPYNWSISYNNTLLFE